MKSHESFKESIVGDTIEHAKELHLSTSTLYKWQEPSTDFTDSGSLNPIDRTLTVIRTSLRLGKSTNPYAPLYCLAAECDHVAIPIPKTNSTMKELTAELLDAVREFGKLSEEASKAMADSDISRMEAARIERKGHDLVRETMEFVERVKESVR